LYQYQNDGTSSYWQDMSTNVGTLANLSVTGNITGGNLIGVFANGNSNISIPAANGNVNISAAGNANIVVVTGTGANVTGTLSVSGNTTTGTLIANSVSTLNTFGFKNSFINGAMVIDQRNAGAAQNSLAASGVYTVDRWLYYASQAGKFNSQQNAGSVTPPTAFSNYLGLTSTSAYTLLAGDYFSLQQRIEGFNFADLGWGTASAKTVTLSFQVYSSLTGTFGGSLINSAFNRSYPFTYTISSANTWTTISVTITGDTTGTWVGATNGVGVQLSFSLGAGSTYSGTAGSWTGSGLFSVTGARSVVGTSGATFYITGVQLEIGSVATSFDVRPYTTELQLCQRYFYSSIPSSTSYPSVRVNTSGTYSGVSPGIVSLPVTMRALPTVTAYPYTNRASSGNVLVNAATLSTAYTISPTAQNMQYWNNGALTSVGDYYYFYADVAIEL
jgi:hypothetical protein